MKENWHGDIRVEWTDGEWERLQKIKRGEYVPLPRRQCDTGAVMANVPLWLRERAHDYAQHKGVSLQEMMKQILYILTK